MSWETGSARIQELIAAGELGQVPPDSELARRMLADARRHLATAAAAHSTGDLSGAYQLAYDALRKSAASLLEAQRSGGQGIGKRTPRTLVNGSPVPRGRLLAKWPMHPLTTDY
jgi:hypothetical protein